LELTKEIKDTACTDLLEFIGWKDEYPDEAKQAFHEFCYRYEEIIKKKAEIYCAKWNYNEVTALDITKCTLAKVWKYPTYNHEISKAKSIQKGITLWLSRIIFTQLASFHNAGTCFQPEVESDLSLVYTFDELAERTADSEESKRYLKKRLEIVSNALSKLSYKHKIIYLTYGLYEQDGRYIPRQISKKLREELGLTQPSIRKYKEEAKKQIKAYLSMLNE